MENVRKFTIDCSAGYITVAENIRNFLGSCAAISIRMEASGHMVRVNYKGRFVDIPDGKTLVLSDEDVLSVE